MKVTRTSVASGIKRTKNLNITEEQLAAYRRGNAPIQDIFPNLSADDREFIMTGVAPGEWDEFFSEEYDLTDGGDEPAI